MYSFSRLLTLCSMFQVAIVFSETHRTYKGLTIAIDILSVQSAITNNKEHSVESIDVPQIQFHTFWINSNTISDTMLVKQNIPKLQVKELRYVTLRHLQNIPSYLLLSENSCFPWNIHNISIIPYHFALLYNRL
jgi:hypothetical protein